MIRASLLLLGLLVACAKSKPVPIAPLPPDQPAEPVAEAPKPTPPDAQPAEPTPPPAPKGPLEVKLPAAKTTVKLVSTGTGKRAPLRYAPKQGGKQRVELALDWAQTQSEAGKKPMPIVMPTILLSGEAETTAVADGVATNVLTIVTTDARDVAGAAVPADKFKTLLTSLGGMVITASVGQAGNTGDTALRIDKPNEFTGDALQIVALTLPAFPALPSEPVGVGAKWQATSSIMFAGKFPLTQQTDYEVTARKGASWTIKGTTKVIGLDQDVGDGTKITGIKGAGSSETTLVDGVLYPTTRGTIETEFTAVDAEAKLTIAQKVGATITSK
ncbi:MAG: hypothetical protein JNL83_11105 [Myxococcales bacterium]|nr:hypothetical protein [Myxococcales bacterium]